MNYTVLEIKFNNNFITMAEQVSNDLEMEDWRKRTEETTNFIDRDIEKHLSKFLNWWIIRLVDKWITYYYDNQDSIELSVESNKEKYKQHIRQQILFYVEFFSKTRQEQRDLKQTMRIIRDKYHKLIYDWEIDPVEEIERSERLDKAKLKTPQTLWEIVVTRARDLFWVLKRDKK